MKKEIKLSEYAMIWCIIIAIIGITLIYSQQDLIQPVSEHVAELRWEELK